MDFCCSLSQAFVRFLDQAYLSDDLLPRRAYTQPHGELVHLWNHVLYHLVAGSSFHQIDRSSPMLELILREFESN
jgi:hypothetical protein